MNDRTSIPEFFTGRDIFITGGSGFLGKALIEKLLRSCSNLNRIYVLIRGKKGKTAEARLKEMFNSEFFNKVREKNDLLINKVTAIDGDVMLPGLGISASNVQMLKNVSIVIHSAASVKFDDPLKEAILMNARGTLETLKLAEGFPNIKAFVHISTTYSNPDKHVVEEELYPAKVDWRTAIKLAENYSTEMLNIFNLKYSEFQPNTYTFTKGLAEQIANDYKQKLPVFIYRPSIVVSSIEEPVPGWIDNFNGPVGMFVASGIGILRTAHGDPDVCLDYMPVDIAVKGLIVAVYKKCLENHSPEELIVYNCSTATVRPVSTGDVIEMAKVLIKDNPMEQTFWVPGGGITRYKYWYYLRFMTLHVLFAILADTILRISNNKPFFLKLQRKIYAANNALHYFNITQWSFQNDKFYEMDKFIMPCDKKEFAFEHYTNIDIHEFFKNALVGAKYWLLKMPLKSSKWAKIKFRILTVVNFSIQLTIGIIILRMGVLYVYRNYFTTNST
ncbi:fatty acyl-CoA reductase 1-like [Episyrphus balteatus]|uniref:fatty acyl-CoA reductase 1-like n=1 Tax=Episyrphus balteatus TaxID=286459 RepID=UPI0024856E4A|nr:fatty acyl-CoA reductase 1-like [Episyrphus balteatus]XP_055842355.1 fatty acyl-CoA reductase 1-like [Episyrphus balteatus]